ncbi:MAG: DUF1622 domain-containing protein [Actinomycetota bacterium]|jgi:uncharacterized membrane protein|nr:DUF1622 domain-containing protein [Solirubrobacterales bacterium]MBA3860874.1 DUF1622 domain-containing protein [Solirubrobacterales bacterium]MDQ3090533.1 DUF1622 domain-containing protein [Actinomycetota bacterium]MDQ3356709.1 DUF1622 domain-containing protein [Actinomycetota bacterium]MDQ3408934.1 DUF1622 domain-containing protein [Actinomycetota bacterium]
MSESDTFTSAVETVGVAIDVLGVATIVIGILVATIVLATRHRGRDDAFEKYRQGIGRAILLGLEFLVAADIIRTVAVDPTFAGAGVLAIIVIIRTFLSFALELEISGRWPWQRDGSA